MKKYLVLVWTFFKLGLFTFGGGYAMIALMEKMIVEKLKYISAEEMTDIVAVSESTPGPLAINGATFIGYKVGGILGSLVATFFVVLPSFLIIYIISFFLEAFLALEYVNYAFLGINIAVSFLILEAGISMFKKAKKSLLFYIIMASALVLMLFLTDVNAAYIILLGGMLSLLISLISNYKNLKGARK